MAQDRLWQLEMWRRWREGLLAEIYGPEAIPYDARTRLLMHRGPFDDAEWTSYHPEGKRIMTAYASGINAYIERNRDNLPVEFKLTGIEPGLWTAETVVRRWTSLSFPSAGDHAMSEIQLALAVAELGVEEANRRDAPLPWDDLKVPEGLDVSIIPKNILDSMRAGDSDPSVPGRLPPLEIVQPYRDWVSPTETSSLLLRDELFEEGSNNWVVSGKLSTTGQVILSNDPHRRLENPSLRYYVHLNAPGWDVIGASEPPFVGVNIGHNERIAWGVTFAGVDVNDVYVEEVNPDNPNQVRWQDGWEEIRILREEIPVKGEAPRTVEMKFSRHGPIFFEDAENHRAYAVRSIAHEPGTAAVLGSLRMDQAEDCEDFFDRAMYWKVPTHNLICGDVEGNIALQVSALTPDRDGWNGRLPVPGTGKYEWRGFRSDLPRELNPERGFIATANNDTHPPGYKGRPVMFHTSNGEEFSRITRIRQLLKSDQKYSIEDLEKIQLDAYSLRAAAEIPWFQGWTSGDSDVERARDMIANWDAVLARQSAPAAIYFIWSEEVEDAIHEDGTPSDKRQALVEEGLKKTVDRLTKELGSDWSQWRYGRVQLSEFPHQLAAEFDIPTVERSGGFGTVAATSVSVRQVMDTADWDRSVFSVTPGQSGQPGSPYYGDLLERWANNEYFPLAFSREAVDEQAAQRLTLRPE
jgi:penicillin amidase